MPIYTFESDHSLAKIRGKIVVADTSYLISISQQNKVFLDFHSAALASGSLFYINVTVRTEFIKAIRKEQLIQAIIELVQKDAAIKQRYRKLLGMPKADFTGINLSSGEAYNKIYKDHVRKGDLKVLLDNLEGNIWPIVDKFEKDVQFNYLGGRQTSTMVQIAQTSGERRNFSWDSLGELMEETCLNSSDALIVNFALSVGAEAIVTTDTDFAQICDRIDIFMPGDRANMCNAYDSIEN